MADQLVTFRQSAAASPVRSSGPARRTSAAPTVLRGLLVIIIAALFLVVIALVVYGWSYYSLPLQQRFRSPLHADLKPSGRIGHLLGSVGSVLLIGLLPHSFRKRFRVMSDWGPLSWWLKFHIFCGIAGPILITFHTSFKVRGIVAISYWSMIAVAASGVFGRYLYAQIPRALSGKEVKFKSIQQELERMHSVLSKRLDPFRLRHVLEITDFSPKPPRFAQLAVILMIRDDVRVYSRRRQLRRILMRRWHARNVTNVTLGRMRSSTSLSLPHAVRVTKTFTSDSSDATATAATWPRANCGSTTTPPLSSLPASTSPSHARSATVARRAHSHPMSARLSGTSPSARPAQAATPTITAASSRRTAPHATRVSRSSHRPSHTPPVTTNWPARMPRSSARNATRSNDSRRLHRRRI